ncbi:small G protein signaling modulator 3, partial [Tremellales sp. Uapishka_1]
MAEQHLLPPASPKHPLLASHPSLTRRASSTLQNPGYFDHATRPSKAKAPVPVNELLGGRSIRRMKNSSNKASPAFSDYPVMPDSDEAALSLRPVPSRGYSGSSKPWTAYLDSLSREELAVLEMRFDLMEDDELEEYLRVLSGVEQGSELLTPRVTGSGSHITPLPTRRPVVCRPEDDLLFPPSPPGHEREELDHPLRILCRAVRELKEVVEQLETENASLKKEWAAVEVEKADQVSFAARNIAHIQMSIHDGLTEALSTSLGSISPLQNDPMDRSSSPPTSISQSLRPSSPSPSIQVPFPRSPYATRSLHSARSVETGLNTPKTRVDKRATWASGLWAWSGNKKPRPRKGSVGSVVSHQAPVAAEAPAEIDVDDNWRKGDGGSPPSFRAIFLSTVSIPTHCHHSHQQRILTPDPSSILFSIGIPANSLIAYLAHSLVGTARDEGIVARDPPGRRRSRDQSRSRAATVSSQDGMSTPQKDAKNGYGDQALAATASLGRTLLSSVSSATVRGTKAVLGEDSPRPSLLSRGSSATKTALSQPMANHTSSSSATSPLDESPLPSVELSSILPEESRPPTVLLSRQNLGTFFQSTKAGKSRMQTASRFNGNEEPLTDRYGFIYDIHHAGMLKDASAAGTPAPMSLNGHLPVGEEVGWIEKRRKSVAEDRPKQVDEADRRPTRRSIDSSSDAPARQDGLPFEGRTSGSRLSSPADKHRHRSTTIVSLNPTPAKPIISKPHLTVSARGASSLQTGASTASSPLSATLAHPSSVPEPLPNVSRLTVSSLLDQLTEIHDRQQNARMVEWDAFLKKRTRNRSKSNAETKKTEEDMRWGTGIIGISQMGLGGKSGQEEWKTFARLVRHGIPLAYRSDVWAECSGAKDLMIPGEYAEILAVHKDDESPVLAEIEKDVSRTFPGNVFFGGDGPGVAKLRRVLIAYSWHNPAVGYCQGMNMLAATLLLTHSEEEQAYWVLLCMIDRLLPKDYFAPSLLASRADQLVLSDLVAQLLPKLDQHLQNLGVDLASVTFGWFLSLFTDCLPVEVCLSARCRGPSLTPEKTLFRVWDVFFVEGHDTLFRVAVAILKLNEAEIIACETVADLFTFISSMTSRLWAADKLISLQHSYKPIIRHVDIVARCEKHVAAVQKELDEEGG